MQIIKERVEDNEAFIVPLADMHLEDKYFTEKSEAKLKETIEWVRKHKNARVILNGDVFNVATRTSKTSPFSINKRVLNDFDGDQMAYAVHLFEPIKEQIICATLGNHEMRTMDFENRSWLSELCAKLSTPNRQVVCCGVSALIFLKVGKSRRRMTGSAQTYSIYATHTVGGGSTPGSKMNRVVKSEDVIGGCDVYFGSHNHMMGALEMGKFVANPNNCTASFIKQMYVDTGGYLDYGGYVERAQMSPTTLGSPKVKFSSKYKLVNVEL